MGMNMASADRCCSFALGVPDGAAQGISAVENICGRSHTVDHNAVPAACFTHPEVGMVGLNEEQVSPPPHTPLPPRRWLV